MFNPKIKKLDNRISVRVSDSTLFVLEYMRCLKGSSMSELVKAILETACKEFNETGFIPRRQNKNKSKSKIKKQDDNKSENL